MFGSTNSVQELFNQELNTYRVVLVDLYKKKAKLVAEREALRFQYLTGFKSRLQSYQAAIYNKIFADKNPEGEKLTRLILNMVLNKIPIVNLQGGDLQGFGQNVYKVGGRLGVGFLSPTDHIFAQPFHEPDYEDQRSAYAIYADSLFNNPSMSSDHIIKTTSFNLPSDDMYDYENQAWAYFEVPPTLEWITAYGKQRDQRVLSSLSQAEYVRQILSTPMNGDTLKSLWDQAYDMVRLIVEKTRELTRIQLEIDVNETNLAEFVAVYGPQLQNPRTLQDALNELRGLAEKSDAPSMPVVPAADPVVSEAVIEPPKKSNAGILAAAAVGIFLATRK